jgi:hypothetical protein
MPVRKQAMRPVPLCAACAPYATCAAWAIPALCPHAPMGNLGYLRHPA